MSEPNEFQQDGGADVITADHAPWKIERPWLKPFINSANARELQAKSCEAKRAKAAALTAPEPEQPTEQPVGYTRVVALTIAIRAHCQRLDA